MNAENDRNPRSPEATEMQPTQTQSPDRLVEAVQRAKQSIETGDLEAGLQAFRDIASANPQIPEVFNNLGAICAAMGLREEAETAFGRAGELTPDLANPWYNRGLMRFESGNNVGALDDFLRAVELDPQDAEILNNIGVVHFQLHHFDEARKSFEAALELRPHYTAASLNLVDVDLAERNTEIAADRCRDLLEIDEDPEVTAKLIECCISAAVQQLDGAASATRRLTELTGETMDLAEQLGRIVRAKQTVLNEDLFASTPAPNDSTPAPTSLLG